MPDNNPILAPLSRWIASCTTNGVLSRNTVAVGIVVLDHLRRKCPLQPEEVQSARGEIKGARSGLKAILEKYGIPEKYLKEVTTRAGHQEGQRLFEAFGYGSALCNFSQEERDVFLARAIESLVAKAKEWLDRQQLKLSCDRQLGPSAWVEILLREAGARSGGKVEQHLVGAKLECRHPEIPIPNNPGHAGDVQTGRSGDFPVRSTVYHVTAAPGSAVLRKCKGNLETGLHPVLVVPRAETDRARHLADDQGITSRMTIIAIEDFIALNILEMSKGDQREFIGVLRQIIDTYNRRLEAVETDMSLKIDLE
jgi:hypothetical protein